MELGGLIPLCITVRSNLKADNPNYGIIKPCTQCPLFKKQDLIQSTYITETTE